MANQEKRNVIPPDRVLRILMKIGIPIAVFSLLCLWLSYFLDAPILLPVFFITALMAFGIGLAYNVRVVLLMLRQRREAENAEK
ncbi:hypothetical protein DFR31_0806 [Alkalispirillum mobile]|uniref:Uncharacterized protein n=1 Tax=Alkalispirillum mobile TaxID=85925 RepID=A0A498C751_9GAMM|nr:hypothetical protein [Alkalispirillum mobile]RLK50897.1 hypothetical protein DFR31_0806 [Alkalispirillum mobile]